MGSFTPNVRIPLDTGLCGAAARTGKTVVVDDVSNDPRYLAGSSIVKSEIVVPIFARKKFAAELDIESYFPGTFTPAEQEFVEACAGVVGQFLTTRWSDRQRERNVYATHPMLLCCSLEGVADSLFHIDA